MKHLILLLLFFATKSITSQNGWTTYSTTVPSGTSATQESAIFIDNVGDKWVGFMPGSINSVMLARYNNSSNTWTFWNRAAMGITTNTIGGWVKDILQDNSGNIWIGTSGGLIKYDGTTFIPFTMVNGLPNNSITSLEYIGGMLYIGTLNGLSRYDGTNFTNYTLANSLFPISTISDVKAETPNLIWITGGNKLISFSINSTFTSTTFSIASTSNTVTTLDKIYIDGSGVKWFVNQMGILKYDNINFTYFETMYPGYKGTFAFDPITIGKGPNNGILTTGVFFGSVSDGRCLIEFLPNSINKFYYSPITYSIGTSFNIDASGKYWTTGTVKTSTSVVTSQIHMIDFSVYSPVSAFGWAPAITNNNYKYLDVNRVKAGIANRGDMWWDIGGSGNSDYEVPKTGLPSTSGVGVHSAFAASIWIGGLDASNQLHVAAQTYRQSGIDFWPGPLDTTNATIDTLTAYNYDKIWKVDYNDINTFITQFNLGNVPTSYTPTPDILNWPAKGTGNNSRNLAPFVDVNNNGIYDPLVGGDYPKIKGDQTLYYIFNDNFAPHTETGGLPFGIEVHAMAYAYGCNKNLNGRNELAYTTFYDYKIYNRTSNNYHDVYVGLWSDVDMGNYLDDYIGSSVQDNLGFCYNSDANDQNASGANGYGSYPPAAGTTILKGPTAPILDGFDNDNDSIIDEPGEQCLMNIFDYYNNNLGSFPPQTTNPNNYKFHYYNYLQAKWKDSTNFTCGGNAYGGTIPTKYVYPWNNYIGNPCSSPWTETTAGNLAGDRRYIVSSGPFTFPAYSSTEFEYAYVWSTDSSATSNINIASANKLISDVRKIRSFYNTTPQSCLYSVNIGVKENESEPMFALFPNPANSLLFIKTAEASLEKASIHIIDVLGKTVIETKSSDLYQTEININGLNSGIYFLNIKFDNNRTAVKKFVKQ